MIEDEVIRHATHIQRALTGLGFAYKTKTDAIVEVSYKSIALAGDQYALYEVDTNRLPPRVSIPKLETPEVLKHLSAVVGKRVVKLNTVGLTYVVILKAPPKPKPFATRVALPAEPPATLFYPWPFGVTREGDMVFGDLLKTGHILIGGKPGSGKSTAINAGLVTLLRQHTPATLALTLVDPKAVELWPYAGIPHLLKPVATSPEEAAAIAGFLVNEVDRRESLFKAVGAKKLTAYNTRVDDPLPLLLAVFDEVTDLVLTWGGPKSPPFADLIRVSSKGRAFGVVLLLATQNPKADILDTALRENSGTRIAFKVDQAAQSRSIIGQAGAEALPAGRPGRCVVDLGEGLQVLQGFTIDDNEVADLVKGLKLVRVSPLKPAEVALVEYARDDLGGAFKLQDLYDRFKGVWSYRRLKAIGQAWESRGWLTKPADAVSPRRLTEELLQLVDGVGSGSDQLVKGSQGSQAVEDAEDAVEGGVTGEADAG